VGAEVPSTGASGADTKRLPTTTGEGPKPGRITGGGGSGVLPLPIAAAANFWKFHPPPDASDSNTPILALKPCGLVGAGASGSGAR
jgi:hypothetical protein